VYRTAQRRQIDPVGHLKLVEEQRHARARLARRLADMGDHVGEIGLQVATVAVAELRLGVDHEREAPGAVDLDGEGGEDAECSAHCVARSTPRREIPQRLVERLRDGDREGPALTDLELRGRPAVFDRKGTELVEQHRLSDTAQAGEHDAALRCAGFEPAQHHLDHLELAVASGELGGALPGARCEGVGDRVHQGTLRLSISRRREA
jgi:hypothetical protein